MHTPLSSREQEIVLLASDGLTDKEIAVRLQVQVATVRTYWDRLRQKLGASNKGEAIAKSLREIVRQQDRWQRLIVECASDYAMFAIDEEGRALSWNPGVKTLLGYEEIEFIGFCVDEIFTPEDKAKGAPLQERETAKRTGRAQDERWHVRKDGTRFFGSGMMMRLEEGGEAVGLAKIVRDKSQVRNLLDEIEQLKERLGSN